MSSIPPKENDDEVIITDKSDADQIPAGMVEEEDT